ncbi:MAG: DUF1800 family protein, partial [Lysobacter sp.]
MTVSKATAANRFGLGARPGEIDRGGDGREVLLAQLRQPVSLAEFDGLPSSATTMRSEFEEQRLKRANRSNAAAPAAQKADAGNNMSDAPDALTPMPRRRRRVADQPMPGADANVADDPAQAMRRDLRRQQINEFSARYRHAARTPAPFVERLTQFWSNHFAVSIDKGSARLYAAPMEREAIRPHVLGRFEDMLLAVETHPAMLRYLDNAVSIGNESRAALNAERANKTRRGLNENLAREILELHTLGVNGGYRQNDVTELARAITGWSTP